MKLFFVLITLIVVPFALYYSGKYFDIQIKKQQKALDGLMTPEEVIKVLKVQYKTQVDELGDRVNVLEKIVTDNKYELDKQLAKLHQ